MTDEHLNALNFLAERYWKPVFYFVRSRTRDNHEAEDLVQEFFTSWIQKGLFGRADPSRGRFRDFLLTSLKNFLINKNREKKGTIKNPRGGFVSIHKLASDEEAHYEPSERETPESLFLRGWIKELLFTVLEILEKEYQARGKEEHYEIFRKRIIEPALEGSPPPPMSELAQKFNLTEKQAANHLLTTRRAYQRLLRVQIRTYATSEEEVSAEVQDLFTFLGKE